MDFDNWVSVTVGGRVGAVKRVTKETNVFVKINLDGTGVSDSSTGIPFLDHMLDVSDFWEFLKFASFFTWLFFQFVLEVIEDFPFGC